jgi:hypothetical protein
MGGLNEVLILVGTIITSYWTRAAAYRYAWHSLYYKRKDADIAYKLPLTKQQILSNTKQTTVHAIKTIKEHMVKSFMGRERVYSLKFPICQTGCKNFEILFFRFFCCFGKVRKQQKKYSTFF